MSTGDVDCPNDGEKVHIACWKCGWTNPAPITHPDPYDGMNLHMLSQGFTPGALSPDARFRTGHVQGFPGQVGEFSDTIDVPSNGSAEQTQEVTMNGQVTITLSAPENVSLESLELLATELLNNVRATGAKVHGISVVVANDGRTLKVSVLMPD